MYNNTNILYNMYMADKNAFICIFKFKICNNISLKMSNISILLTVYSK